jgi:hypothetical protein
MTILAESRCTYRVVRLRDWCTVELPRSHRPGLRRREIVAYGRRFGIRVCHCPWLLGRSPCSVTAILDARCSGVVRVHLLKSLLNKLANCKERAIHYHQAGGGHLHRHVGSSQ